MPKMNISSYGCAEWSPGYLALKLPGIVRNLNKLASRLGADFAVVRGTSGVLMAGMLMSSSGLDVPLVLMRKRGEQSHACGSHGPVPQWLGEPPDWFLDTRSLGHDEPMTEMRNRYLILDDLVASGRTVRTLVADMGEEFQCVGVGVYCSLADPDGMPLFRETPGRDGLADPALPIYGLGNPV